MSFTSQDGPSRAKVPRTDKQPMQQMAGRVQQSGDTIELTLKFVKRSMIGERTAPEQTTLILPRNGTMADLRRMVVRKKYRMHDIPENYRMLVDNVLLESVTKSKLRGRDVLGRQVTVLPKMYGGDNLIVRLSSTWYTFKTDEPRKNVRIMAAQLLRISVERVGSILMSDRNYREDYKWTVLDSMQKIGDLDGDLSDARFNLCRPFVPPIRSDCVRIEVLEDGKERLSHRLAAMFYTDKCDPMSPAASRHCCMDTAREVKDSFDGMLDLEKKRGQASPVSGMTILKYIETSQHCGVDRGVSAMAMMFVDLSRERWNASVFDDWVIDAFVCMCNCISLAEMDNHMELMVCLPKLDTGLSPKAAEQLVQALLLAIYLRVANKRLSTLRRIVFMLPSTESGHATTEEMEQLNGIVHAAMGKVTRLDVHEEMARNKWAETCKMRKRAVREKARKVHRHQMEYHRHNGVGAFLLDSVPVLLRQFQYMMSPHQ